MNTILSDLRLAFTTGIGRELPRWGSVMAIYLVSALSIGFAGGIFHLKFLDLRQWWFLLFTLLIFPSLFEELFFRGILLRRTLLDQGWNRALRAVLCSAGAFTLWHPINALTINPTAQSFFLSPVFLLITFLLGIATGVAYLLSRSIWVPVLIHWLTVVVWVFLLGGRNLVMES